MRLTNTGLRRVWGVVGKARGGWTELEDGRRKEFLELARSGHVDQALAELKSAANSLSRWSPEIFEEFIALLGSLGRTKDAEDVVDSMTKSFRLEKTQRIDAALLTGYLRSEQRSKALELVKPNEDLKSLLVLTANRLASDADFESLRRLHAITNSSWTNDVFATIGRGAKKTMSLSQATEGLRTLVDASDSQHKKQMATRGYCELLSSCNKTGDVQGAKEVYKNLVDAGVRPNSFCITALLSVYVKAREFQLAEDLVRSLKIMTGLRYDAVLFGAIMDLYARQGNVDEMLRAKEQMLQRQLEPIPETITAEIRCYSVAGLNHKAEELFARAANKQKADLVMYTVIIDMYAKLGHSERILDLLMDMKCLGLHPNVYAYSSLIFAFGRNFNITEAVNVLEEMKAMGVTPNLVTYTTLVSAHLRVGDVDGALKMFDISQLKGLKPDFEMTKLVTKAFAIRHGPDTAAAMIPKSGGEGGYQEIVSMLLRDMAKSGSLTRAFTVLGSDSKARECVENRTYNEMIKFAKGVEEARFVFSEMKRLGAAVTVETVVSLLHVAVRDKQFVLAGSLCELLEKQDNAKSREGLVSAVRIFAQQNLVEDVISLVSKLEYELPMNDQRLIARCFARHGDVATLRMLKGIAEERGKEEEVFIYASSLAYAYAVRGDKLQTETCLNFLRSEGQAVTVENLNASILSGLLKPEEALNQMKELALLPDQTTLMCLFRSTLDWGAVMNLLSSRFKHQLKLFETVIETLKNTKQVEEIMRTVRTLEEKQLDLSVLPLNKVLELQVSDGTIEGVVEVLCKMSGSTSLTSVSEQILLEAFEKHGSVGLVKEILCMDSVSPPGAQEDAILAVLSALRSQGRNEEAQIVVEEIRKEEKEFPYVDRWVENALKLP